MTDMKFCHNCGVKLDCIARFCPSCGTELQCANVKKEVVVEKQPVYVCLPKSRVTYVLLGLFFGTFGLHNFYAGRHSRAVWQLILTMLTGWLIIPWIVVAVWSVIDICTITTDGNGASFV